MGKFWVLPGFLNCLIVTLTGPEFTWRIHVPFPLFCWGQDSTFPSTTPLSPVSFPGRLTPGQPQILCCRRLGAVGQWCEPSHSCTLGGRSERTWGYAGTRQRWRGGRAPPAPLWRSIESSLNSVLSLSLLFPWFSSSRPRCRPFPGRSCGPRRTAPWSECSPSPWCSCRLLSTW